MFRSFFVMGAALLLGKSVASQVELSLIPQPRSIERAKGEFIISDQTWLAPALQGEDWSNARAVLADKLKTSAGIHFANGKTQQANTISFHKNSSLPAEGYELEITPAAIRIGASSGRGAFYAVQTLLQLLPPEVESGKLRKDRKWSLPCLKISDSPAFGYRGFMLDVARHFMLVDDIRKLIDAMAMQKLNVLQLHLTDNQGWRFESKKYPNLVETGAFRKGNAYNTTYDYASRPRQEVYGGYYTQQQLKDLVAYAKKRFITIVPEIEMPAHSIAALASYPELLCSGSTGSPRQPYDFGDGSLCTRESTFRFLFNVLDEVMNVFPSKYIHIAGDEAAKQNWRHCYYCNQRMKELKLKNYDELQSYFIKRISQYLVSKGRKPIGWDEILEGGLAPGATVMSWRGEEGGVQAVKQGHPAIMTPTSHCYFDYYLSRDEDEPPAFGGYIPLEKVYNYHPVPEGLTASQAALILGAQANLWTESIPDFYQAAYMIFPRLSALSEVVWRNPADRDYPDFVKRLTDITRRLQFMGINYSPHRYELNLNTEKTGKGIYLTVAGLPTGLPVHYTLDGSLPTPAAPVFGEGIPETKSAVVTVAIFDPDGNLTDKARVNYVVHKGMLAKLEQLVPPDRRYSDGGNNACNNGILGSNRMFKDNEWLGWYGLPFTGLYRFDEPVKIHRLSTRFFHNTRSWVWYPQSVEVLTSGDGKEFRTVVKKNLDVPETSGPVPFSLDFEEIETKYLKVIVTPRPVIPRGFNGAGNPSWIMVDEMVWQ